MLLKNPAGELPRVNKSAYISEYAVIIGNVEIGENVIIAPNATIRADEPGSRIIIGSGCNIQDNVVIHALQGSTVLVGNKTSLSHGCIVHGPCTIGNNCFIGFGSVVFNCVVGNGCVVQHMALLKDVTIPDRKTVNDGMVVNEQDTADKLDKVTKDLTDFATRVVSVNLMLSESYPKITHKLIKNTAK
ncbi:MAG: carbonate dehydratase [Candidatus Methanoperedens sp.]|jgi:carbonic anhydrase/acetyltransferase-like protein (isoleucine patch superfamily)|nr:carbonate dehydratase [Candidatus Methanoperedens sp.]PKL53695.1 MAG: carbonate dehydratase [Candidatus Methanoperedenaceae archaeon HGW-Methanoperedenaceae-1]